MSRRLGFSLGLWSTLALAQDVSAPAEPAPEQPPVADPVSVEPAEDPAALEQPPAPIEPLPVLVPLGADAINELNLYIDDALATFHVPGAAVGVIQNGEIAYLGAFGVRDAGAEERVGQGTRFMIGSVSKSMTTTLAASLVAEGRLAWSDPIVDYLPGFALSNPDWSALVTLADAFGHTSGVPRSDIELLVGHRTPLGLVDAVSALPAVSAPGERYEYHNQMFSLGGFATARAAGVPLVSVALGGGYAHLLQRRVLEPLGMDRTTVDFELAVGDGDHANPHAYDAEELGVRPVPVEFERAFTQVAPAGAVWSDVVDMSRYLAMHLREGESIEGVRVVPEATLLETHAARAQVAPGLSYGLGWLTADGGAAGPLLTHDGGTVGFNARVAGFPALDFGVVILVNRSGGAAFMEAVTRYVFELGFGVPHVGDTDLVEADSQGELVGAELLALTAPVDPASVAELVGPYERRLSVRQSGEDLLVQDPYGELRFRAITGNPDTFLCVEHAFLGLGVQFSTDDAGNVTLTLGLPNFESGELIQQVVAARLDKVQSNHPRHAPFDFRQLPLPHLASPMHLEPLVRHPWGQR